MTDASAKPTRQTLQDVLECYHELADRISRKHWRVDEGPVPAYNWGRKVYCSRTDEVPSVDAETGRQRTDKRGNPIWLKKTCKNAPLLGRKLCGVHSKAIGGPSAILDVKKGSGIDPMTLVQLKADVDRQIDALPKRIRAMFHLRYRVGLAIADVCAALDFRQSSDFMQLHEIHLAAMERRLIDWFPPARETAAPVEPEAVADDLQVDLVA